MSYLLGNYKLEVLRSITDVAPSEWDACLPRTSEQPGTPFIQHSFMKALETSHSAMAETGWLPYHLILRDLNKDLIAACPLYLKNHSQGEYVFDQNWAHAFERAGGRYYPKLQCAIPFSPITGPRLLSSESAKDFGDHRAALAQGLIKITKELKLSSSHVTFCTKTDAAILQNQGFLIRNDTQFYWENKNYNNFEDFLGDLTSRKRKNIRKERRSLIESGISTRSLTGKEIGSQHWDVFFEFYVNTYDRKWGYPYLTREFFSQLSKTMADQVLLVLAYREKKPIAGAINFFDDDALYGRNWGCSEEHKYLHFETCYYAAIDFAIKRNLKRVEAGTQGSHKLQRGYVPHTTYSAHWIEDKNFRKAIAKFLKEESIFQTHATSALSEMIPFRKG